MKQSATFDSSSWINAHRSQLFKYVLSQNELDFAPAVGAELRSMFPSGQEFWRRVETGELIQRTPQLAQVTELGPGERATINLALEHPGWILLIDDRRPLRLAEQLGVPTVCTPLVVVQMFRTSEVSLETGIQFLARLSALQTISPQLIDAALASLAIAAHESEE